MIPSQRAGKSHHPEDRDREEELRNPTHLNEITSSGKESAPMHTGFFRLYQSVNIFKDFRDVLTVMGILSA